MRYKRIIYLFVGILLLVTSYLLVSNNYLKFILLIMSLFCLLQVVINKNKLVTFMSFIGVIILTVALDFVLVSSTDIMPLYSIKYSVGNNVDVYERFNNRVWDCNSNKVIDNEINESFMCSNIELEGNDSNVIVHDLIKSFDDFEYHYLRIDGKVNRISSNTQIDLRTYVEVDETLNGYVEFSEDLIYRFNFNDENSLLDKYYAYDYISIIGQLESVSYIDNQTILNFVNSKIIESDLYDNYELVVTSKEVCEDDENNTLLISDDEKDIYNYCLDSVVVRYNEEIVYDLSYLLQLDKIKIEEVLDKNMELEYVNDNVLYDFDDFRIIKCVGEEKSSYIIGSNSLTLEDMVCTNINE